MRFYSLFLVSILITSFAFVQPDPEFVRAKQQGDACYARHDWACAQQHYSLAVAIKPNDSHCQQRLKQARAEQSRQLTPERQALAAERAKLEAERRAFERRQAAAQQPAPPATQHPTRQSISSPRANMIWVPGGSFQMGSNEGRDNEKPVHRVTVSGFWMDKYEVTQQEWENIMGNNPSRFKDCPRCPVEMVSWDDVQGFIVKLNAQTGKRFRLPTEAEWEYAAREGGKNVRFGNGKDIADPAEMNFDGSAQNKTAYSVAGVYRGKTTEVGSFSPNALGLYDMSGNVYEWCQDWYGGYASGSLRNPTATDTGTFRVLRGGSWFSFPLFCRFAFRYGGTPAYRFNSLGFRLVSQ